MTGPSDIPLLIRQFLHDCITSVAQLEALLWLAEQSHTDWTPEEVSAELRSNPSLMSAALADLHNSGLLTTSYAPTDKDTEQEIRYRYCPSSAALEKVVAGLTKAYRERRHSVLAVIYSPRQPNSLQAFSDAFRLREDANENEK
jgi:predicted transcriptional regulator